MTEVSHWQDSVDTQSLPQATLNRNGRQWTLAGLHPEDHIFKTIRETDDFYESRLLDFLGGFVQAGDLVLDIGANIGNHTVWFAGVLGCSVRAFEPVPVTAQVLAQNVILNMLDSQVQVVPYAVGSCSSKASVSKWHMENTGGTEIAPDTQGPLTVVALDDMDWGQQVRLIKIDVEGMEIEALRGAQDLIHRDKPVLAVEARDEEANAAIRAWLENHHYSVLGVFNATPTLVATPNFSSIGKQSDHYLAAAIESLVGRFEEFESRLERFGRYLQSHSSPVSETRQTPPVEIPRQTGSASRDEIIQSMRRHIDNLELRLDSAQNALKNERPDSSAKDGHGAKHD